MPPTSTLACQKYIREGGGADDSLRNRYGCHWNIGLAHILWWLHRCIYRLSQ